jgi:RNA polymerase sigma-70 factor (ECF subfamily)
MIEPSPNEISQLLMNWSNGDSAALDELIPIVYSELRRLANRYLRRERSDHTLQPTALVHEAYLRLMDQSNVRWQNRAHFFGVAAQMMRRILVDHAKARRRTKRGGCGRKLSLDDAIGISQVRSVDLVALDDALTSLAEIDARKSRVVEMRYFGGLCVKETAEVLGVSANTVMRDWTMARAWLYHEIKKDKEHEPSALAATREPVSVRP